jgi:hypothetical protein
VTSFTVVVHAPLFRDRLERGPEISTSRVHVTDLFITLLMCLGQIQVFVYAEKSCGFWADWWNWLVGYNSSHDQQMTVFHKECLRSWSGSSFSPAAVHLPFWINTHTSGGQWHLWRGSTMFFVLEHGLISITACWMTVIHSPFTQFNVTLMGLGYYMILTFSVHPSWGCYNLAYEYKYTT